jgi:BMFP domain-containing protein YqiC
MWTTRLRAADLVLSHSAQAIEIEDIEARVAELETRRPSVEADAVSQLPKLLHRIRKLESRLTGCTGLAPHSEQ